MIALTFLVLWAFVSSGSLVIGTCIESDIDVHDVSLPERALVKVTKDQVLNVTIILKNKTGQINVGCLNTSHCEINCKDIQPWYIGDPAWQRETPIPLGPKVKSIKVNDCLIYSDEGLQILRHIFRKFK